MKNHFKYLLGILVCGTFNVFGQINLNLQASQTSGVAPLSVFFDATSSSAGGVGDVFADVEYRWDFGNPQGETWQNGVENKDKNTALGPVVAHVYDQPGSYLVTLTGKTASGLVSTATVTITVEDPDQVFSGPNTICMCQSGDFTGCPDGSQQVTTSTFADITSYIASGKRILLRRGEIWASSATISINESGPGIIGSYGTGGVPVIQATADITVFNLSAKSPQFDNWRFMDLEIDGQSRPGSVGFVSGGTVKRALLYRLHIHHTGGGISFGTSILKYWNANGYPGHTLHEDVAVVESTVTDATGGGGDNLAFIASRRFVFQGNYFRNSTGAEHVLRMPHIDGGVVSHNNMGDQASTKEVIKLHAPGFTTDDLSAGEYTQNVVISENLFENTNAPGAYWMVVFGPQNAIEDERLRKIILERNHVKAGSDLHSAVLVFAQQVTVRNNLFNFADGNITAVRVARRGVEPDPADVSVYNNTFYTPAATSNTQMLDIHAEASNVSAVNNLMYLPASASGGMFSNEKGTNFSESNNLTIRDTSPFVTASPLVPGDFELDTSGVAYGGGLTLTGSMTDFSGAERSLSQSWDIGSHTASGGSAPPTDNPPSVPQNLTASPLSATEISVSWSAASDDNGVTGYRVYRDEALVDEVTSTSLLDSDLTPATSYTYRVSAFDATGNESSPSASVVATTHAQDTTVVSWQGNLTIAGGSATQDLKFGVYEDATDGYDAAYDVYSPPLPPSGSFDARFEINSVQLLSDFRADGDIITWNITIQAPENEDSLLLSWDITLVSSEGSLTLTDASTGGNLVRIDMKSQSSAALPAEMAGALKITRDITPDELVQVSVLAGWNLTGLPLQVDNNSYLTVFPSAETGTLYGYDGSYLQATSLSTGKGYWLKFPAGDTVSISGTDISSLTLDLNAGWNLISGVSEPVSLLTIEDPGNIIIDNTLYTYSGSYQGATTIEPGKGYWIRTSAAGQITLTGASNQTTARAATDTEEWPWQSDQFKFEITVQSDAGQSQQLNIGVHPSATDGFDPDLDRVLPPAPVQGAFDVRMLANGESYQADIRKSGDEQSYVVHFNGLTESGDFQMAWDNTELASLGTFILTDHTTGGEQFTLDMSTTDHLTITHGSDLHQGVSIQYIPAGTQTVLGLTEGPQRTWLGESYPNPSFGNTTVPFSVAADSHVVIELFSLTGQKVLTIADGRFRAGSHVVHLNAGRAMPGMYLIKATITSPPSDQSIRKTDTEKLYIVK